MIESPILHAASLVQSLTAQLAERYSSAIEGYPPQHYISELIATRTYGGYSLLPAVFSAASAEIELMVGLEGMELYHKLVIAILIAHFGERCMQERVPDSIVLQYEVEFRRILAQFDTNISGFYVHGNDLFSKDLAICRGKLIPCGAELIDKFSGVPRRIALCGGVSQLSAVLRFFTARSRGFRPFYEMHMDPRARREFTPKGWDCCYLRIADLLEMNAQIKGVFGSSWWYDPQVERITPRIGYLRRRPLENGARIFRMGSDEAAIKNSTSFSRQRKEQYEKGEYLPTNYAMIWARSDLLHWARQVRAEGIQA